MRSHRKAAAAKISLVFFDSSQGFFQYYYFFLCFVAYSAHATSEFGLSLVQNTLRNTKIKQANAAQQHGENTQERRKREEKKNINKTV